MSSENENESTVTQLLSQPVQYQIKSHEDVKKVPSKLDFNIIKNAFNKMMQGKNDLVLDGRSDISFYNLCYHVKKNFGRDKKCVLNNVSGEFHGGELTAIMGPSGAGKTSLLDVIAGYITTGISGKIMINGVERNNRVFSKNSCYIMQDEELHVHLTVHESMVVAVNLKLGTSVHHKQERINRILESLGLMESKKVKIMELSGGQRKRLAIALELVNNPQMMFFDEPTSGLDSSTSAQCVKVLQNLAREGKTIVCTIHQPSALIFEMFDHFVMLASGGQCVYSGSTKKIVQFLESQGLICPPYHNPVDFFMETISESVEVVSRLVNAIDNGSCKSWRKPVPVPLFVLTSAVLPSKDSPDTESNAKVIKTDTLYQTNFTTQLSVLLVRNFKKIYRNKFFFHLKFFAYFLLALFIGTLYYDIGNDAHYIFDNYGFLFFGIITVMFFSFSSATITFPLELTTLKRENFNSWYSVKAFYIAINISTVPVELLCTMVFNGVVYILSSQPLEFSRYFYYNQVFVLTAFVGQSFGFLIGASMSIQNAFVFGPFALIPFMAFAGYFVLLKDAPYYTRWLFHISFVKYGFEGAMLSIYENRSQLECSSDYCHFKMPSKFMDQVGMDQANYVIDCLVLLLIILVLRVAAFICLKFNIKSRDR